MSQKTLIAILAIVIIVIGLVYYYGGNNYGAPNPSPTPAVSVTPNPQGAFPISIKNFAFSPAVLNIKAGDTVTWTNNDSASHRISGGSFQSSDLSNGQNYSFTFNTAGTYDYICSTHPSMKGQIVVK